MNHIVTTEKISGLICKVALITAIVCLSIISVQLNSFATTVTLQWDPVADTSIVGYKVYYQADSSVQPFAGAGATQGNSPVDASKQTTATISGLDSGHAYYFAVTAYNATGESAYSNLVSVPELSPPVVSVTSPSNNSSVGGSISVTANATDNVGVTKVEFYVNGVLQSSDTASPYVFSWNTASLASGSYALMAKAYDAAGNVGQSSDVAVSVVNDSTAPTVSLTAPANNATVTGTVTLTATATDNVGVSKVEFYENGSLLSATNTTPYSYSWSTASVANGAYTLYAKAYDSAGNIGQSTNVTVTVSNDATPPTVTAFTLPATATSLTVPVSSFTATDNVGVTGYLITTSSIAPAASATGWSTTVPASFTFTATGTQTAYAWAKDATGNVSAARNAAVVIDTTAPVVTAFTLPATATSLTVPVSSFTATDNVGVTGYLITTSSTAPAATDTGWSTTVPASFTFAATGTQTAYAWTKDAAGNISAGVSAKTTISVSSSTLGETTVLSKSDSGNGNMLLVQSASLTKTAAIQSMSIYITTASGKLRMGIYDATGSGGGPGKLLATTAEITPVTGWNKANVTTPVSLASGTYWLAFLPSSGSLTCKQTYNSGTAQWAGYTYGAMPSTFPAVQGSMKAHWSLYATLN